MYFCFWEIYFFILIDFSIYLRDLREKHLCKDKLLCVTKVECSIRSYQLELSLTIYKRNQINQKYDKNQKASTWEYLKLFFFIILTAWTGWNEIAYCFIVIVLCSLCIQWTISNENCVTIHLLCRNKFYIRRTCVNL